MRGVSEDDIKNVEARLGSKFPQAYREFLYLAGEYSGGISPYLMPGAESLNELAEDEDLKGFLDYVATSTNIKIERPFWPFSEYDGYLQYWFFYLDDGDNPPVYGLAFRGDDPYTSSYIYPITETFTQFVDELIDHALRDEKLGYWTG